MFILPACQRGGRHAGESSSLLIKQLLAVSLLIFIYSFLKVKDDHKLHQRFIMTNKRNLHLSFNFALVLMGAGLCRGNFKNQ